MAPAGITHQSVTRQSSINHPSALARSSVISQLSLARSSAIAQSSVGHRSVVNQSPISQHSVINQPPLNHRSVIALSVGHRSIIGLSLSVSLSLSRSLLVSLGAAGVYIKAILVQDFRFKTLCLAAMAACIQCLKPAMPGQVLTFNPIDAAMKYPVCTVCWRTTWLHHPVIDRPLFVLSPVTAAPKRRKWKVGVLEGSSGLGEVDGERGAAG